MDKIAIQGHANTDKLEFGWAERRSFSPADRTKKIVSTLAIWWGAAILAILLPVVHFVLVPLFFILGVYFTVKARKISGEILAGEIKCPKCAHPLEIHKQAEQWPISEICQNCSTVIRIGPKSETSSS